MNEQRPFMGVSIGQALSLLRLHHAGFKTSTTIFRAVELLAEHDELGKVNFYTLMHGWSCLHRDPCLTNEEFRSRTVYLNAVSGLATALVYSTETDRMQDVQQHTWQHVYFDPTLHDDAVTLWRRWINLTARKNLRTKRDSALFVRQLKIDKRQLLGHYTEPPIIFPARICAMV